MNKEYDVIIIGGGASGLMAAAKSASEGKIVLLLEKNKKLAAKLLISGGGRCNITNAQYNKGILLKNYGNAEKYLYSPFSQFGVEDTFNFFESNNLPLIIEDNNRVFPKSEKARDVYITLKSILDKFNVNIMTSVRVTKLHSNSGKISGVETDKGIYHAKSIILSTGGISHPETGSTGDGFKWLKDLGHSIKSPSLTIVPLAVKEDWVKSIAGVSIKSMKIGFYLNGKKKFSKEGAILFTHFGISGPLILNSSSRVNDLLEEGEVTATIDIFPDIEFNILEDKILYEFNKNSNKSLKNVLKKILPEGISYGIQTLLKHIDFDKKVNSITKEERKIILHTLKALPLSITGLMGEDRAVAADGGVSLDEIDLKTMRSRLYENLFITGDLLHINRPSGGYSLQLCWTTGFIAGLNA